MRIRPYLDKDFDTISTWITDERSHALWCANRIPYPLKKDSFNKFLIEIGNCFCDNAFVATTDGGDVVGFFCFSVNIDKNEGMLKFVVIDNTMRDKGYGSEMIRLAVKYAFEIEKANTVQLNVFPENIGAKKCYEKVGFQERSLVERAFVFQDEAWGRCNMVICNRELV
ncbi:MAG: GNAT family N-acetyltransferase [Lachnospiraceae bacterium]|nr:GNAT family N-acetyltransferase [Lachnospiraceae bacterium]